jgi:hypothetical protein
MIEEVEAVKRPSEGKEVLGSRDLER